MSHVPLSGTYLAEVPKRYGYSNSQFPFTGSSVMLALRPERSYKVEIVIFGGANEAAVKVRGARARVGRLLCGRQPFAL